MGQIVRFAGAVLAVMLVLAGFADAGESHAQRVALPVIKIEKGAACVAPTEEMRRDHMKMLLHQRDLIVHQGLREVRFSLKNCVDCHASRETGSVLGKEGFCSSCHTYAAVSIDCFECHTPLRQSGAAVVSR
jgi:hypothetical protein